MSKKQMGFTLIEIVMVLVLLGILSAVAVPKYFDLRAQAEEKALDASVAELQSRVMATFAKELLQDTNKNSCVTAITNATKTGDGSEIKDFMDNVDVSGWKLTKFEVQGNLGDATKANLTFKKGDKENTAKSITLPTCK